MPFTYCTQCGYKNVFTTQKAKFCAGCGQSLLLETTSARVNPSSGPQSAPSNSPDEPQSIPNIQKLEYSVDVANKNPTIGDLINTRKQGNDRVKKTATAGQVQLTREQLEAESMRDCGSSVNQSAED